MSTDSDSGPDPKEGVAEANRDTLRANYLSSVSDLLEALNSRSKASYSTDDLTKSELVFKFSTLKTQNSSIPIPDYLHLCLSTPMSCDSSKRKITKGASFNGAYRKTPSRKPLGRWEGPSESYRLYAKADQIHQCLDYLYTWYDRSDCSIEEGSQWVQI